MGTRELSHHSNASNTLYPEVKEKLEGRYYGPYKAFVRDVADPKRTGCIRVYCPGVMGEEDVESQWLDWCRSKQQGLNVPPLGSTVWIEFEEGQPDYAVYTPGWLRGSDLSDTEAPLAGLGYPSSPDPTWLPYQAFKDASSATVSEAPYATGGTRSPANFPGTAAAPLPGGAKQYMGSGGFGPRVTVEMARSTAYDKAPVYPYNKTWVTEQGHTLEFDDTPGAERMRIKHKSGTQIIFDFAMGGNLRVHSEGGVQYSCNGDFIVGLRQGSSFKVVSDQGAALSIGPDGFNLNGLIGIIMGRTVAASTEEI